MGKLTRLLYFLASAWIAVLDLAVGMMVVFLVETGYHTAAQRLLCYIMGATIAVLPDLDIVFMIVSRGHLDGNHHEALPHRPILMFPVVTLIVGFIGGSEWVVIAWLCLMWHYTHDTHPFGGGLAWLWPFSNLYWSPVAPPLDPKDSVMATASRQWEWMEQNIFRPTKHCIGETVASTVLFFIVLGNLWTWWIGLAVGLVEWIVLFGIWWGARRTGVIV